MVENTMTSTGHLILPIEKEVFGDVFILIHITKAEVLDVCAMDQLNVNCITTYMR